MTVAELRAALAGYPDDMQVCVRTRWAEYFCLPVGKLAVHDIVHEDDGGFNDVYASRLSVPTLTIHDVYDVVGA